MINKKNVNLLILFLVLSFIISRLILYIIGVRFDASPLNWFYQFLDPVDLKNNLCRSIFYLHIQPPLFNLFLGLVLKIVPDNVEYVFMIIYSLVGLLMVLLLFKLLTELKISSFFTILLCLFFMMSPPIILFENWLFYDYFVSFLLLLASYLLYKYINKDSWLYIFLFFLCLGLIILTRAIFHLIWFLIILIGLLSSYRNSLKKIFLSSLIPLVFVIGFYLKNYIIFKQFTLSSWFGMNLIKMTWTIPLDKIANLIQYKKISDIAVLLPFEEPEVYLQYANFDTITNIQALDRKYKTTGAINFNNIGYISVSQKYYTTAKYLITRFPQYYLVSVAKSFYAYLKPCSDSTILKGNNRSAIYPWVNFYEYYLLGGFLEKLWHTTYTNRSGQRKTIHLNFLYILLPLICGWGIIILIEGERLAKITKAQKYLLAFIMFNIFYITIVSNLAETGENMRYRFLLLPYTYILLGFVYKRHTT